MPTYRLTRRGEAVLALTVTLAALGTLALFAVVIFAWFGLI